MWHQFINCNQAAAFWDLFSDANISQGWQLFTANQCLLKWIPFMLNPKSLQGQPSYVQNLIIHCHPYALADQSATCIFGPQGSAQVIFPPFFPPRDPPISLDHPNMDVFNANSSVTTWEVPVKAVLEEVLTFEEVAIWGGYAWETPQLWVPRAHWEVFPPRWVFVCFFFRQNRRPYGWCPSKSGELPVIYGTLWKMVNILHINWCRIPFDEQYEC